MNTAAEPIGGAAACKISAKLIPAGNPNNIVPAQTINGEKINCQTANRINNWDRFSELPSCSQSKRNKAPVSVPITAGVTYGLSSSAKSGNKIPTKTPAANSGRAWRESQFNNRFIAPFTVCSGPHVILQAIIEHEGSVSCRQ